MLILSLLLYLFYSDKEWECDKRASAICGLGNVLRAIVYLNSSRRSLDGAQGTDRRHSAI